MEARGSNAANSKAYVHPPPRLRLVACLLCPTPSPAVLVSSLNSDGLYRFVGWNGFTWPCLTKHLPREVTSIAWTS